MLTLSAVFIRWTLYLGTDPWVLRQPSRAVFGIRSQNRKTGRRCTSTFSDSQRDHAWHFRMMQCITSFLHLVHWWRPALRKIVKALTTERSLSPSAASSTRPSIALFRDRPRGVTETKHQWKRIWRKPFWNLLPWREWEYETLRHQR